MAICWNNRGWAWVLGLCLVLFMLVGFALPAIGPNVRQLSEASFCQQCGVRRVVTRVEDLRNGHLLEDQSRIEPTALSTWHEAHYPLPCQHAWQRNHCSSRGYYTLGPFRISAGAGESGSAPTPSLLSLSEEHRKELDRMYAQDEAACQVHIAEALR